MEVAEGRTRLYRCDTDGKTSANAGYAPITPWGQLAGAAIMFLVLGFLPCYIAAWGLKRAGVLRIPREVELAGLDHEILALESEQRQELESAEAVLEQESGE